MVEPGLSVQTIDREDMSHSWSDITVALYLMDYCFAGPVCSLWAGRECGRGADNEICLTDPRLLAIVKTDTPELSERLADLRRRGGRG
jgi:hypothetical protein